MLIYIVFILILFCIRSKYKTITWSNIIIYGSLVFSGLIVLVTESFSLINAINPLSIISFWSVLTLSLIYYFYRQHFFKKDSIISFYNKILKKIVSFSLLEKTLFIIILLSVISIFLQGILYPPNNWDSLTYHLSRIMYWLSNENVNHFSTHILRHLYQPPFAEYVIMHINVIQGNDYLSNTIQLFYLVLSLIVVWQILDEFKVNRLFKFYTLLFILTIPSVALQASTTKNDIICGFFVITSFYFLIKCYQKDIFYNYLFLGLSIGIGILTKGTAYIFLTPMVFIFIIFKIIGLFKLYNLKTIKYGLLSVFVIILINIGHFSRNYSINKNILNIDTAEGKMYSNDEMNGKLLILNFLKNVGLHIDYPLQDNYDNWIRKVHSKLEIDINNVNTNYLGIKYQGVGKDQTNEDNVPNNLHLIFISTAILIIVFNSLKKYSKNKIKLLFTFIIILQLIIFVAYLKWQPWHTRLHIPVFMLSSLLIAVSLKKSILSTIYLSFISVFYIYNFWFIVTYNNLRPLIKDSLYTKNIDINEDRFKKYFSNQLHLYKEYQKITFYLKNDDKTGLMLSDWEYPILSYNYHKPLKIKAINVGNVTKNAKQKHLDVNIIIANHVNQETYVFENNIYKNITPFHQNIWMYSKIK